MNKRKYLQIIIVGSVLLAVVIGISFCLNTQKKEAKTKLALGKQYLSEIRYEEALAVYQATIEIDDRNVEAYIGMAEAYVKLNNVESAIRTLQKGYELTGDERLQNKLLECQWELQQIAIEGRDVIENKVNIPENAKEKPRLSEENETEKAEEVTNDREVSQEEVSQEEKPAVDYEEDVSEDFFQSAEEMQVDIANAMEIYKVFDWKYLDSESYETTYIDEDGNEYYDVSYQGSTSYDDIRNMLLQTFSADIVDKEILAGYKNVDGRICAVNADKGGNPTFLEWDINWARVLAENMSDKERSVSVDALYDENLDGEQDTRVIYSYHQIKQNEKWIFDEFTFLY